MPHETNVDMFNPEIIVKQSVHLIFKQSQYIKNYFEHICHIVKLDSTVAVGGNEALDFHTVCLNLFLYCTFYFYFIFLTILPLYFE